MQVVKPKPLAKFAEWIQAAVGAHADKRVVEQLRVSLRLKENFLAAAAHEMRNPLAPITCALQLLARRPDDPVTVHQAHAMITRQVLQLTRLINDLLDFSQGTHGQLQLRKADVDLAEVAAAAIEMAQPHVWARTHVLITTLPPAVAIVSGDSGRLTQVLANLLINASKFTERRGQIWLTVGRDRDVAFATIRDTGVGIPAHMLERIFEVYVRGDTSQEGVGLGLALARQLVELHQGTLIARSDGPGKGSEFTMRLPLARR
jgi:signal transduction histidine kinase